MKRFLIAALTLIAASSAVSSTVEARSRDRVVDGGYVIAESRFGNGSIEGAVRETDLGPQVQMPSGRWEYCRRSCTETLRVETIDFNENHAQQLGGGGLANECGVFGCLDVGIGRRSRY